MEFSYYSDSGLLSKKAAELSMREISADPGLLFCAATGNSPELLYENLVMEFQANPAFFKRIRIIKLDEWWGIPPDDPGTCESYLQEKLVGPLGITGNRFLSFASDAPDPNKECLRIQSALEREGPIGLAVLGLGKNGHLGLNEPGPELELFSHQSRLSGITRQHAMVEHLESKPESGMTLGMKEILSSKVILLIVSGEGKEDAFHALLSGRITTFCPASFLWLHPRVHCLVMQ
ncbi:MAG: 6-phosphogluconolactonase [Bacteroidales bacterium]